MNAAKIFQQLSNDISEEYDKLAGLNADYVIRILRLAGGDLPSLEGRYYSLRSELKTLEAKKESLIRIIQDYNNQLTSLGKSFDSYCRLCQEEEEKLTDLQRKRLQAESLVSHFENNNDGYVRLEMSLKTKYIQPYLMQQYC